MATNDQLNLWSTVPEPSTPVRPLTVGELPEADRLELIADPSRCFTPIDGAAHLGVGRTTVYRLMADGELTSITIGRCRRIPLASIAEYVARQLRRER